MDTSASAPETVSGWHFLRSKVGRKTVLNVMYYLPSNYKQLSHHVAAFDLVNTLIWPSNGDYTIRGVDKWVWRSEKIPEFLCKLYNDGWTIVIFSNYISKHVEELSERIKMMFADVERSCGQPIDFFFFASLVSDAYQKPNLGMWKLFSQIWEQLEGKPLVPNENSFYVGDRAGDPNAEDPMFRKGEVEVAAEELIELGLTEGTHVGDDSLFAARAGLVFFTPAELPEQPEPDFPPEGVEEIIIMVGQQGSGKTSWAIQIAKSLGYTLVTNENVPFEEALIMKDKKRRLQLINRLLAQGNSVIVDATHPSQASRKEILDLAKARKVPARIFWVSRPGRYYNQLRDKPVPEIALRTYTKHFEIPTPEEGAEVVRVV